MQSVIKIYAPLVGRILLGGFFVWSGVRKVLTFPAFVGIFEKAGYANAEILAIAFVAVELLFGIGLVIDVKARFSSLALALYLLASTCMFMRFATNIDVQLFLQNMAIVGGLLIAAAHSTSRWTPSWQR